MSETKREYEMHNGDFMTDRNRSIVRKYCQTKSIDVYSKASFHMHLHKVACDDRCEIYINGERTNAKE